MCRSDGLIGLSSTRTSASPGAKGGLGISASFNTLFGSPVSRKINAFINTSWVFRRRLNRPDGSTPEAYVRIVGDFRSGTDRSLDELDGQRDFKRNVTVSPDGSKVIFQRECKDLKSLNGYS